MFKKSYLVWSLVLAAIVATTAIYGLFVPNAYSQETLNWVAQSMAQDWINTIIAVPAILVSSFLAYKGSLAAKLIWLGTLVFTIYSYLIYTFMVHFNPMFLLYLSALGISTYLFIFSMATSDFMNINGTFTENWSRKFVANSLIFLGVIFYLVWLKDIIPNLLAGTTPQSVLEAGLFTNGVYVIDLALCLPLLILSGYYLKKGKDIGYILAGASIVFALIMMINIAFIIYFVGYRGLPTDMSIAYVFGFLCLLFSIPTTKYLLSFNK